MLNGQPVTTADARVGDVIQIGATSLRLTDDGADLIDGEPSVVSSPTVPVRRDGFVPEARDRPGDVANDHRLSENGEEWVPLPTGPAPPLAVSASPSQTENVSVMVTDNSFVWALAFTPFLYLLVDVALGGALPDSAAVWGVVIALAVNSTLVLLDHRRLPDATRPNIWLGLLLVPIYLFQRSSRLRQTMAIPVVWCVAFAVSLAIPLASGVGASIDTSAVEQSIEAGIQEQLGFPVTAECPAGISAKPESTFQCTIEDDFGVTAIVDVTIQNSAGDIVWEVRR